MSYLVALQFISYIFLTVFFIFHRNRTHILHALHTFSNVFILLWPPLVVFSRFGNRTDRFNRVYSMNYQLMYHACSHFDFHDICYIRDELSQSKLYKRHLTRSLTFISKQNKFNINIFVVLIVLLRCVIVNRSLVWTSQALYWQKDLINLLIDIVNTYI